VARDPEKKNLLCILVGEDKPGVAAKISATLSHYQINIEFSKMIAREDVFLMELLVDCKNAAIPLENLEREIETVMAEMKIKAVIQREDVFNKKKRWLVFSLTKSLLPPESRTELAKQAGLAAAMEKTFAKKERDQISSAAASLLDEMSAEAFDAVVSAALPTAGTQELVQTLKTFGYRVAISALAAEQLVAHVGKALGVDAVYGLRFPVDEDTKRLSVAAGDDAGAARFDEPRFIRELAARETLAPREITVVRDTESALAVSPGIRLEWNLKTILELHNRRVLSADNVLGLFGCFGIPTV
jgi:predicted amino acid-binding ACT domain protein